MDCRAYVGTIEVAEGSRLNKFKLVDDPTPTAESNWISALAPVEDEQMMLSVLLTALATKMQVKIWTRAPDACSIMSGEHELYRLRIENSP